MKSLVRDKNGACGIAQKEIPALKKGQLQIEVKAASFNRGDYANGKHLYEISEPGRLGPGPIVGADASGIVTLVSPDIKGLKPGDRVCAICPGLKGAMAEFANVDAEWTARIPDEMSFEQAAGLPSAGVTALAAIKAARITNGMKVLVCGASGGVGQYATLLAAEAGAEVNAACRSSNFSVAKKCGASKCFDYGRGLGEIPDDEFDAIIAVNGKFNASDYARILRPGGTFIAVGLDSMRPDVLLLPLRGRRIRIALFFSEINKGGLPETVRRVAASAGTVTLQTCKGFSEGAAALASLQSAHPSGKVVVSLQEHPTDEENLR